jgi:molybdopterin-guanine dinucleotide biosynthesis protein A
MGTEEPIQIPRMLLIGSMGRNSGKTVMACSVIDRLRNRHRVIGLKVSTIHTNEKRCLRGGAGCGVCTSLEGDYCLTVERSLDSGKDTARMLAGGASEVFWLRVRKGFLREGIESFLAANPGNDPIVCESNSLREVVEPGVFLMMKRVDSEDLKTSAAAVLEYADETVEFNGEELLFSADGLSYRDDRFALRLRATLILLAGGGSRRMGQPKSLLPYRGVPLIEYVYGSLSPMFAETLVSTNDDQLYNLEGARFVPDRIPGYGPIGGISAALAEAQYERTFVTACDIPTIHHGLIAGLLRLGRHRDIVVPRTRDGRLEPLHAVYGRSVLPEIERLIEQGEKRIRHVYEAVDTCFVALRPDQALANINTPDEYSRATGMALEDAQ